MGSTALQLPPPPPPPSTGGDVGGSGQDGDPAVVWVINQRPAPGDGQPAPSPLPAGLYQSLSGAAENARRDLAFATASPEDRARMLGMDPFAATGDLRSEADQPSPFTDTILTLIDSIDALDDPVQIQLIHGQRQITGVSRHGRATDLEDAERAALGLPPRTRWSQDQLTPERLGEVGTSPGNNAYFKREFVGDGIDIMNFARDIVSASGYRSSWSSRSGAWRSVPAGQGGIVTFTSPDGRLR